MILFAIFIFLIYIFYGGQVQLVNIINVCAWCFCVIEQWRYSASTKGFILLEVCNYSASSSRWSTAWKHAPLRQLVSQATTIRGYTSATNIPTWRPVTGHGHTHSSFTSAKCLVVSYTCIHNNYIAWWSVLSNEFTCITRQAVVWRIYFIPVVLSPVGSRSSLVTLQWDWVMC